MPNQYAPFAERRRKRLLALSLCIPLFTSCQLKTSVAKTEDEVAFERLIDDAIRDKADLNQVQIRGHNALFLAARSGYIEAVEAILSHGGDPNVQDNGFTPLHALSEFTNPDIRKAQKIASLLIDKGADVNAREALGATPLSALAGLGPSIPPDLIKLLLNRGADPNIPDDLGITALHAMVLSHDTPAVHLLLARGAQTEVKSKAGQTPLQVAAMLGFADVVKALLDAGADPNATDDAAGKNAFEWCQEGAKRNRGDKTADFASALDALQQAKH